uniref:UDP-N-acetylmuramoyl-tripeptide--D-alanyl-D- alanine ligase n=1 Tax=Eubacterium cellulosolvens TaxID=29322 RepID=UPI00047FABAF|nr:UDP-N-acetylmuramoyl-tripeptide--D-alanyl-D-alanine ligase [[Eubacterium] cellulosolvens]
MKNLTLRNITEACGGTYTGPEACLDTEITGITTDSRTVSEGGLFVAIRGEKTDGHRYVAGTFAAGALAALVEERPEDAAGALIQVPSTLQALKDLAEFYLAQLPADIVGVIGSVGKTSTKEMLAAVLGQKFRTLKTEGNFNNEIGVPLTAFRMREEDEIGVLEMGINHFGEMHRLAKITRPKTVVFTNVGTAHLEFLGSRDGILKAKSEVFDYMDENGQIIVNGDDDKLSTIEQVKGINPIRFGIGEQGFSHKNDVWADGIVSRGLDGISCRIHTAEGGFDVTIPSPGKHMVYNALAGTAAGLVYGLSLEEIRKGIESYMPLGGRFHIIKGDAYTVIDDCYNANPGSMKASISILKEALGRRVAILGDMGELGENEKAYHEEVGVYAAKTGIDLICCVGKRSEAMAEAAGKYAKEHPETDCAVRHYPTVADLLSSAEKILEKNDTILVKASHSMEFGRIVTALCG